MTHSKLIMQHLSSGKPLTRKMAFSLFGCFELSARITELRQAGQPITGHMVATAAGQRVKLYYLEKFKTNYAKIKSVI